MSPAKAGSLCKNGRLPVNRFACGIINRQAKMQLFALRRQGFRVGDRFAERRRNPVASADYAQANALVHAVRSFREEIFVQQTQNRVYFVRWSFPVRGRKRE